MHSSLLPFVRSTVLLASLVALLTACGDHVDCSDGEGCVLPDGTRWVVAGGAGSAAGAAAADERAADVGPLVAVGSPFGASADGIVCDAAHQGVAYCASAETIVLCHAGAWYTARCSDVGDGLVCAAGEGGDTGAAESRVDCIADPR